MRAIITVGLGFGDEGKGATVDALTRSLNAELVVRYSGGAQAGHNVVLADGRRHTFSQFGAGTLAGARTYLGPRMIISPATLVPEADHLQALGVDEAWSQLSAHPDCLVATDYHVLMNRLRESSRRGSRHGSCGMGVGETRHYWLRYGQDAIFARDLDDRQTLLPKLSLLRERFLLEMQELEHLDETLAGQLHASLPHDESNLLRHASEELAIASRMPTAQTVIFEGGQGVLLDEWKGFHPHTTWSTVTPWHARELLADFPDAETYVMGITRAYTTRHGQGPFPTHCPRMSAQMTDAGNPHNAWQGAIRFGPLDLVLTEYAARVAAIDGIVINCLDQLGTSPRICREYRDLSQLEIPHRLTAQAELTKQLEVAVPVETVTTTERLVDALATIAPVVGTGYGLTHQDHEFSPGRFRQEARQPPLVAESAVG